MLEVFHESNEKRKFVTLKRGKEGVKNKLRYFAFVMSGHGNILNAKTSKQDSRLAPAYFLPN